jgi:ParB-like chromosome segregation protein Spo0J
MSAKDNLGGQFAQLPMFMPAKELRAMPVNERDRKVSDVKDEQGYYVRGATKAETDDEVWDRKTRQAGERGDIKSSIAEHGVMEPVHLAGPGHNYIFGGPVAEGTITDGHHRIASAYAANPDAEVPVKWD